MSIKDKLTQEFQSLLSKTDKKSFTEAKLKFYETIFTNYADEDNLYVVLTAFEMACDDFVNTNYSEKIKKVLLTDFQNILFVLSEFQSEK